MEFNWIALLLATLAPLVIGFFYYNAKFGLGAIWQKTVNLTEDDLKKGNMPLIFIGSTILAFFTAFFLYILINFMHDDSNTFTFGHGAFHGVFVAVLVVIPTLVTNALYEQKSWKYMLITVGYWVLCFAAQGGIVNVLHNAG